jgi:hypothetical protein
MAQIPLPRKAASTLIQLRTSHFPINEYLHKRGLHDTPHCPHCADRRESVFHFLMLCPKYKRAQDKLWSASPFHAMHIAKLLCPGAHTRHLMSYIAETGRFKTTQRELPNRQTTAERTSALPPHKSRPDRLQAGQNLWIQMGWALPPRRSQSPLPTNKRRGRARHQQFMLTTVFPQCRSLSFR